ncbi:DNA polymerase [Microbacterium phage Hendrix]|uniref:DNA polymerase I n=1 Tax=Microbacterium phage Hendrix TaxID=2182341 RepID=A0A2U8UUF9_9CAUD|nr:DNA polymerase [Microbacterium phage Hendrix]AWN07759.1 DNA polymerase I [Microbacterium phage Hendrix]
MAGGAQNDGNKPGGPIVWVMNDEDFENLIEAILVAQKVVVDLETTGLVPYAWTDGPRNGGIAARVALASYTLPDATRPGGDEWDGKEPTTWILPLSHPDSPFVGVWRQKFTETLQAMKQSRRPISNVNLKFDAKYWWFSSKIDLTDQLAWDPQLSGHLLDENEPRRLKERAPKVFGIERWDDVEFDQPGAAERADLFTLGFYAARDTYWTWRLEIHDRALMYLDRDEDSDDEPMFPDEIQNARLGKLATWVTMPTMAALTRMESRGFAIDRDWIHAKIEEDEAIKAEGLELFRQRTNMPHRGMSMAPTSLWFIEAMKHAVEDGLINVQEITKGGKPSWGKNVLVRQERLWDIANPGRESENFAGQMLKTKQATKRLEFLKSWLVYATRDGFIHASYNIGSVVTGRLSSSEPNLQQVTKKLRPAYVPRPGYGIAAIDYSQLELRVAAFVSRSPTMIQAFIDGKDLHRELAATINHIAPDKVTDLQRTQAKAGNFGLLYLMGAAGFRSYAENVYGVSLTEAEAVAVYRAFFKQWEGMHEWHQQSIARLHRDGYVTSPIGRVRRLPDVHSGIDSFVTRAERAGVNAPVQGFGADLMNMATASIMGLLPGTQPVRGAFPVNTVHDEVTVEVELAHWEEIVAECQDRMTNLNPWLKKMGCELDVPLKADATVGTRWSLNDIGEM